MRLIEHKTALYGIQIFLRTNIDTDSAGLGFPAAAALAFFFFMKRK